MSNKLGQIELVSISKKYTGVFDPLEYIKQNSQNIILLESADIITKLGEKSMILSDFLLKIECVNNWVEVRALIPEGNILLDLLEKKYKNSQRKLSNKIRIFFDSLGEIIDTYQKFREPNALDILRDILKFIKISCETLGETVLCSGVFSYDFLDHFEVLPKAKNNTHNLPDFVFFVPMSVVIIEHKTKKTRIISHALYSKHNKAQERFDKLEYDIKKFFNSNNLKTNIYNSKKNLELNYNLDLDNKEFCKIVNKCKNFILDGHVYQIVPSRCFSKKISNAVTAYKNLRELNPSPHMFYIHVDNWVLFGASPETFIRVDKQGKRVFIRPIAGTRRRGFNNLGELDAELDYRQQVSLVLDEKELAEHMMLVDLARNDIAAVAKPRSRHITRLMGVDKFSHVMHLVSEIEGLLEKDFDALSAYQSSMNMGTLMGAPKIKAAQLLRGIEKNKRGFYGGAVGYLDHAGNLDTAIIIRSALVQDNYAYVRAGCGVVHDSDPELETQETINKAEAVLRAIQESENS